MKDFQKTGGVAALIEAATYLIGFALAFSVMASAGYGDLGVDPAENAAFLVDNQAVMYVFYLVVYVVNAIFLVVLALALYQRLKAGSPALVQTATALGLIWAGLVIASGMVANIGAGVVVHVYDTDPAQAGTVWLALHSVVEGLGGGNEIVGGLWVLLLSWAALRSGELPRALNYLGALVGVAGLVTVIPALGEPGGAIFGLGLLVWFAWVGIVMLRSAQE